MEQGAVVDEQGSFVVSDACQLDSCPALHGSEVVLDTGATANLACFDWLRNHNCLSKKAGHAKAAPSPTLARFEFGNGHMETVKHAADVSIVVAAKAGVLRAFFVEQNAPALLSEGALGPWGDIWIILATDCI